MRGRDANPAGDGGQGLSRPPRRLGSSYTLSRTIPTAAPGTCGAGRAPTGDTLAKEHPPMKIVLWIIGIIFLIGLLVVLGTGALVF